MATCITCGEHLEQWEVGEYDGQCQRCFDEAERKELATRTPSPLSEREQQLAEYANYVALDTGLSDFEARIVLNSLLDYAYGEELRKAIRGAIAERERNAD